MRPAGRAGGAAAGGPAAAAPRLPQAPRTPECDSQGMAAGLHGGPSPLWAPLRRAAFGSLGELASAPPGWLTPPRKLGCTPNAAALLAGGSGSRNPSLARGATWLSPRDEGRQTGRGLHVASASFHAAHSSDFFFFFCIFRGLWGRRKRKKWKRKSEKEETETICDLQSLK